MTNPQTGIQTFASEFEKNFQAALPRHTKSVQASLVAAGMAELMSTAEIKKTFCENWTEIESVLGIAIKGLKWWNPIAAVALKAFISAFKTTFMPMVCPTTTIPPAK